MGRHIIVFPRGEVKTWSDLTPGALFGVSIGGETHLAVKIQTAGDKFSCAVLTALPTHYVRAIEVQNSLLYVKIVPVGRRLQFSSDALRPQPGSLLQNSRTFSPPSGGSNHIRLRGPRKVQEVARPYVVIQEWKIVLRGLDEHEVIFEWPDKTP